MLQTAFVRAVVTMTFVAVVLLAPWGAGTSCAQCVPMYGTPSVSWQPWGHPDPENWGEYGISGTTYGCETSTGDRDCSGNYDTRILVCHAGGGTVISCASFTPNDTGYGVIGSVACHDVEVVQATVDACVASKDLEFLSPGTTVDAAVLLSRSTPSLHLGKTGGHQGSVDFQLRVLCGCDSPWASAGTVEINHVPEISNLELEPTICGYYELSFDYEFPQSTSKSVTVEWLLEGGGTKPQSFTCNLGFQGTCPPDSPMVLAPPPDARAIRVTGMGCSEQGNTSIQEAPVLSEGDKSPLCDDTTKEWSPYDDDEDNQPDSCESEPSKAAPIRLTNGNMTYYETDALSSPVAVLTRRVYDSANTATGVFGKGWFSVFDSTAVNVSGDLYRVRLEDHRDLLFDSSDGITFSQVWPGGRSHWTLSGSGQLLRLTNSVATQERTYDLQQGGHMVGYRQMQAGRAIAISYDASGNPTAVTGASATTDPWTWTIAIAGGLIDTITTPEGVADYSYTGSFLDAVSIGSQSWRYYDYGSSQKLEEVADGSGVIIERHQYYADTDPDFPGWAMTSETADEAVTGVEYQVADGDIQVGRAPNHEVGEYVTRLTWGSGLFSEYYIRPIPGRPDQVVQIEGRCPCGAAGDFKLNAFDTFGRLVRTQSASGAITEWTYDSANRVTSLWRGATPSGCDPTSDPDQCRLADPEALLAATLDYSDALQTTYQYGDATWPSKVTQVCRPSVLQSGSQACTTYTFDATNGSILTSTRSGWVWDHSTDTAVQEQRVTTYTVYGTSEGAAFNPATEAGAEISLDYESQWASWVTLDQPAGLPKQIDGPLLSGPPDNAADVTVLVYYPIDSSVPGPLQGRLAASKNPLGEVTFYDGYDQFGNATRVIDARGVVTEYQYDGLGRMSAAILKGQAGCDTALDPLCTQDLATTYQYSGTSSRAVLVTGPGVGNRHAYEYETAWGRLEIIKRGPPTGDYPERVFYQYPMDGLTSMPGPRQVERYQAYESSQWVDTKVTQYGYDASMRLAEIIYPDGGLDEYSYDRTGKLVSFKDANHSEPTLVYSYDPRGRLMATRQLYDPSVDHPYVITEYEYDTSSHLIAVTDANGNVTSFCVDDFGQTYSIVSGVTGATDLAYDRAGRPSMRVDARGNVELTQYDDGGEPESQSYSDGGMQSQSVTYGFTAGRLTSATTIDLESNSVVETWTYDRRGRLLRHERDLPDLSRSAVVSYGYDAEGLELWHAARCTKVVQEFDYAGRPTEIRVEPAVVGCAGSTLSIAEDIEYTPFGPVQSLTRGPIEENLGFDQRYRMTSQVVSSASGTLFDRAYSYDRSSNLVGVTDNLVPARSIAFGYDDLSRLRSATRQPSTILSWEYDLIGNRQYFAKVHQGEVEELREYDYADGGVSPKLTEIRIGEQGQSDVTRAIEYDAAGNITDDGASGYEYDLRNRLRMHSDSVGSQDLISFRYDANGWRVFSRSLSAGGSSVDSYLLRDAMPFIEVTLDGSLGEVSEVAYVYLGDILLARVSDGSAEQVIADRLTFPYAVVDSQAQVVWQVDAGPYGRVQEVLVGADADDPLRRFPGQWSLWSALMPTPSAILYNIHRWYWPENGIYTQPDPVGLSDLDYSAFGYARANPLSFVDKLGLQVYECTRRFRKSPDAGAPPWVLNHRYACVPEEDGSYTCDSVGPQDGAGVFADDLQIGVGGSENDVYNDDRCHQIEPPNACIEECIKRKWDEPRRVYAIGPLGEDCQEYTERVVEECRKKCTPEND